MADPKKRIIVDGIDFASLFQFPRMLSAVTAAMQPPRLLLALLMVVIFIVAGRLWDSARGPIIPPDGITATLWTDADEIERDALKMEVVELLGVPNPGANPSMDEVLGWLAEPRPAGWTLPTGRSIEELDDRASRLRRSQHDSTFASITEHIDGCLTDVARGVLFLQPNRTLGAVWALVVRTPIGIWRHDPWFAVAYGVVFLLVMSIGGGAICRMSACAFAGQQRLRIREALDFALGNWSKLVLTPMLPLLIATSLGLILLIPGILMNVPWLNVVGGLAYGLAMCLAFILSFLLLGYSLGAPMLIPAIACENCDAADAQQRAYAYLISRPLHLIGYGVIGVIGFALGYTLVNLFGTTMMNLTAGIADLVTRSPALERGGGFDLFSLSMREPVAGLDTDDQATASLIGFWQRLVIDLIAAYVISYFFTGTTMLYLLMRRVCDGQDVEEIWRPGLAPGTLVPLPRPRVQHAEQDEVDAAAAASESDEAEVAGSIRQGEQNNSPDGAGPSGS